MILNYADRSPGNIKSFIGDLILTEILDYNSEGPFINADEDLIDELSKNMNKFYERRIKSLSDDELKLAQILSAINVGVDSYLLKEISGWDEQKYKSIYNTLCDRNILNRIYSNSLPQIISQGLKIYIYDSIVDKKEFHSELGNILYEFESEIELTEISRHYELAERYDESYNILIKEIKRAERVSAFSYSKQLLEKVLEFPLKSELISDLTFDLANVCISLGQFQESIDILAKIKTDQFDKKKKMEFDISLARSLNGIGESERVLKIYNRIIMKK